MYAAAQRELYDEGRIAMTRMGRPKKEIDVDKFEKLCAMQCSIDEVCFFLGVTAKTLERFCKETYGQTFSKVFKEKRVVGLISLRRSQFKLAEKSPAMAIFLGKQYLGQSDDASLKTSERAPSFTWEPSKR